MEDEVRKKKLAKNTISSLVFQLTTIVCGFILPRLILNTFGSEVNGLVNSITQFLQIIAFLELGVGAVVQSSLYKPLAEKDNRKISQIIVSANKFFKRLAQILLVYIIVLFFIYPHIAKQNFGFLYSGLLILAISISSFAQYYFGIVDGLLLTADQYGYIQYNAQTVLFIINTIACFVLIKLGFSIHIVKLTTSIIFLLRPLYLRLYVNKHYDIDRKATYEQEPIKQKWNGVAQHVAAVVLDGTDNIVLTIFADLASVSIYSVYNIVFSGVKQLLLSMTNGVQSLLGELWAKKEYENLYSTFGWFEWIIHTAVIFVFGCTGMLIVPFVQVYTVGVNGAQYTQVLFAVLMTMAQAGHCLRLPYKSMILAAGYYKQTQSNYIIAAILNIIISIIAVFKFGLVGVAIGTLVAMVFQTLWMAVYDSKNLIKWPLKKFSKQIGVDILTVFACTFVTRYFKLIATTFVSWIILAVETATLWAVIIIIINLLFYREKMTVILKKIIRR